MKSSLPDALLSGDTFHGDQWVRTPALLGVVRLGAGGEIVLPESVRESAGLAPGNQVLFVRSAGRPGGVLLMEAGRARRIVDETLRDLARLRVALEGHPAGKEQPR